MIPEDGELPLYYYAIIFGKDVLYMAFSTPMLIAMVAFFARIRDALKKKTLYVSNNGQLFLNLYPLSLIVSTDG